jgi:hypothetical protein
MVIVPHPPYSPDLASYNFALFPKLKMKLKGQHFETVSDAQMKSQAALDSTKENDFHCAFETWKKNGITIYIPEETILKKMATNIEYVKPEFLLQPSLGNF